MISRVIAVTGLPGSGKSRILDDFRNNGYSIYDDINREPEVNYPKAFGEVKVGRYVAISDIIYCDRSERISLEKELGVPIKWIFMQNDPWQCVKNCLFRFLFQKPERPLHREIYLIKKLSPKYIPYGDIRPVPKAARNITIRVWTS